MGSFVRSVNQRLQEEWDEMKCVQEKWDTLKMALCDRAKTELGYEDRRQPDWFRESEENLKLLFLEKNRLYALWLSTGKEIYKKKHRIARTARRAVRTAKDAWFQRKALEAERGRHYGKLVWKCIRDIQRERRGVVPMRLAMVKDENGSVCTTTESQHNRWRRHFNNFLNLQSEFDMEELERVPQRQLSQKWLNYQQRRSC